MTGATAKLHRPARGTKRRGRNIHAPEAEDPCQGLTDVMLAVQDGLQKRRESERD